MKRRLTNLFNVIKWAFAISYIAMIAGYILPTIIYVPNWINFGVGVIMLGAIGYVVLLSFKKAADDIDEMSK